MEWLGVDLGVVFLAADSDGKLYGFSVIGMRDIRKGARNAKRARKEFHEAICHIAKEIVEKASATNRGIALESWAGSDRKWWTHLHDQLRKEANKARVPILLVNRAYTSQTCPFCQERNLKRDRTRTRCQSCGKSEHADVASAMVIRQRAQANTKLRLGTPSEKG